MRPIRAYFRSPLPTALNGSLPLGGTSYLRKLVGYAETYRHDLHIKRYALPNVRVLTVTPGRARISNIIAAYHNHTAALVSPKFFLFADRAGLGRAHDWLQYPWLDAAGEQHRLLE